MSGNGDPQIITKPVYRTRSSAGLMSGLFGCFFAVLGIFSLGLLFLPFAVLFSLVSLLRSATGGSSSGFCAAAASSILTIIGFVVSPTTWLVLLGLIGLPIANSTNQPAAPQPPVTSAPSNAYQYTAPPPDNSGDQAAPPAASVPAPTPPPELDLSQPASPQLSTLQGFEAGAADRAVMEAWFNSLSGSFKDGAEFWAANRSLRPQPTCDSQVDQQADFYQGCMSAKNKLDQVDVRRLSDPEYRAGWNTPPT